MKSAAVFFIATHLALSNCQVIFPGACQDLGVVQPFDPAKYLGTWYEIEKYPAIFEGSGRCVYAIYSDNGNGTIGVRNTRLTPPDDTYSEIIGYARQVEPAAQNGKLVVKFPSSPEGSYWVLNTDYNKYSIVWSCTQRDANNAQFLWFLSKERNPSEETRKYVRQFLASANLDGSKLETTDQSECPNTLTIL